MRFIFKKEEKENSKIYCFLCLPILKIKDKGDKYKIYFLNIPVLILKKKIIDVTVKLFNCLNFPIYAIRYASDLFEKNTKKSDKFVCLTEKNHNFENDKIKLISFYLPQFHEIPLNNENFGKGFTEWSNVTKAIPQFIGHYQPQLPYDVGFYDLANVDVMYRQVELAKKYGVYGFCFHYYWFSGDRLLEKPIFNFLNEKNLEMPFCLCWANENWSKLWDGMNKEVIKEQKLNENDDEKFFNDILPFFNDKRYIKINNKPILIVYRPNLFSQERFIKFTNIINDLAKRNGFDGVYFMGTYAFSFNETTSWNLEALVEFPPHHVIGKPKNVWKNYNSGLKVVDLEEYIKKDKFIYENSNKLFKAVFPSWDNTARKAYSNGCCYTGVSPENYKYWLKKCIEWTNKNHSQEEQFVFINAWNEWAEGAHLEPDTRYGYAYLQATLEAVEDTKHN